MTTTVLTLMVPTMIREAPPERRRLCQRSHWPGQLHRELTSPAHPSQILPPTPIVPRLHCPFSLVPPLHCPTPACPTPPPTPPHSPLHPTHRYSFFGSNDARAATADVFFAFIKPTLPKPQTDGSFKDGDPSLMDFLMPTPLTLNLPRAERLADLIRPNEGWDEESLLRARSFFLLSAAGMGLP